MQKRHTHRVFMDLAGLPKTLVEIIPELRREQKLNDSLALKLARAARNPEKNDGILRDLGRQKEKSDARLEALEPRKPEQAFLDGWLEAEKPAPKRAATPTPQRKRRTAQLSKRE